MSIGSCAAGAGAVGQQHDRRGQAARAAEAVGHRRARGVEPEREAVAHRGRAGHREAAQRELHARAVGRGLEHLLGRRAELDQADAEVLAAPWPRTPPPRPWPRSAGPAATSLASIEPDVSVTSTMFASRRSAATVRSGRAIATSSAASASSASSAGRWRVQRERATAGQQLDVRVAHREPAPPPLGGDVGGDGQRNERQPDQQQRLAEAHRPGASAPRARARARSAASACCAGRRRARGRRRRRPRAPRR